MARPRAIKAGLLYCAVVFGAGFVLGTIRVLLIAPLSGEFVAVLVEAPVMLAISWTICGWVAERLEVSEKLLERVVMGGVALAVLLVAEAFLAVLAHPGSLADYFLSYGRSAMVMGLLAQLAFAIFPIVQRRRAS